MTAGGALAIVSLLAAVILLPLLRDPHFEVEQVLFDEARSMHVVPVKIHNMSTLDFHVYVTDSIPREYSGSRPLVVMLRHWYDKETLSFEGGCYVLKGEFVATRYGRFDYIDARTGGTLCFDIETTLAG